MYFGCNFLHILLYYQLLCLNITNLYSSHLQITQDINSITASVPEQFRSCTAAVLLNDFKVESTTNRICLFSERCTPDVTLSQVGAQEHINLFLESNNLPPHMGCQEPQPLTGMVVFMLQNGFDGVEFKGTDITALL